MTDIDVLLEEHRKFKPAEAFRSAANVALSEIYARAAKDYEAFWAECARELEWSKPFTKVLDWKPPRAKWFMDGELNASVNCVDRHARGARRDKPAIVWEGEPGDARTLTYGELLDEVSRFASVLDGLGVKKGDRVAIYLPMIPEAAIAMLGCARVGAVHSVVFGGFSAESLRDRIVDAQAKVLITADGGFRRGQVVPLKKNADDAIAQTPTIEHVVVVRAHGAADRRLAGADEGGARSVVARADGEGVDDASGDGDERRGHSVHAVHVGDDGKAEGNRAHHGRLSHAVCVHDEGDLRSQGRRRVLVHGRRGLGDGAFVHRVRAAGERCDVHDVRGRAGLAREGPLLGAVREVRRDGFLHGADGDSRVHEVGRAARGQARSLEAAAARIGG